MNEQFNHVNERFKRVEDRISHLETWIRWLLGTMIGMWITIILAILLRT